jgi:hypothetical protein
MTIARSLLGNGSINIDGFPGETLPPVSAELLPKKYNVMLHKVGGKWNDFVLGHVVTYLEIDEWCEMKGYKIVQVYNSRPAYSHERTDLF